MDVENQKEKGNRLAKMRKKSIFNFIKRDKYLHH